MTLGKPMILANRYLFNPVYKNFTWFVAPFGTVVTRDRHTGKVYSVPMGVYPLDGDRVMIPMSYSRNVNWVTNVLADGGAQVWYKGKGKQYENPHFISAKEAYDLMPVALTGTYRAVETTEFMVLDPIPGAPVDSAKPMKAMVCRRERSTGGSPEVAAVRKMVPQSSTAVMGKRTFTRHRSGLAGGAPGRSRGPRRRRRAAGRGRGSGRRRRGPARSAAGRWPAPPRAP